MNKHMHQFQLLLSAFNANSIPDWRGHNQDTDDKIKMKGEPSFMQCWYEIVRLQLSKLLDRIIISPNEAHTPYGLSYIIFTSSNVHSMRCSIWCRFGWTYSCFTRSCSFWLWVRLIVIYVKILTSFGFRCPLLPAWTPGTRFWCSVYITSYQFLFWPDPALWLPIFY